MRRRNIEIERNRPRVLVRERDSHIIMPTCVTRGDDNVDDDDYDNDDDSKKLNVLTFDWLRTL